tara:strand:+ start:193 stop:2664 length:2472 start_codon:yes stop_codon:yes gene_type:complete
MKLLFKFFILFVVFFDINSQNLKSPSDFLGYEIGTQYSRHSQVVDYFNHVSIEMSKNVSLFSYGKTYERRPLFYAVISSEKNIAEIEKIRLDNISALNYDPIRQSRTNDKAIVWLSYSVHGNESSSTEASMQTVYELLTNRSELLENTIVIIDPCLNPDGRDRYANWYNQTTTIPYNTNRISREHREPWPGGRANHYLFDLNRDWAWITQIESQQRLKEYHKWLPHVHVDFHEQGIDEPYYFAPAAEPYHEVITDWQRDFQYMIGKNNAKYFDKNGWLYFTKEIFDLLYPSYGDTYPTYLGAIGMTYEQAGGGIAGLGILNSEGKNLTLVDRVKHHTVAGISTVEISSANSKKLNEEFINFFKPKNFNTNYIMSGDRDKINQLSKFLREHKIDFYSTKTQKLKAFSYNKNKITSFTTSANDLIIPNSQPKGKLVDVLLERTTKLSDSLTYDITAWSLPFVYGLDAYSTSKKIEIFEYKENSIENTVDDNAIAYASIWNHMNDAKFLSNLIENNIKVRYNEKIIKNGKLTLPRGSMIIYKGDQSMKDYEKILLDLANDNNIKLHSIYSGISESGPDLGSESVKLVKRKKVAIISGQDNKNSVSSLNYGALWHFFEQELSYPLTHISVSNFEDIQLDQFDALIIPSGYYGSMARKTNIEKIRSWISKGGNLIAFENAIRMFVEKEGFSIKAKRNKYDNEGSNVKFEDLNRNSIQNYLSGAIFKVDIDNTHPLAFGYQNEYYSLKTTTSTYENLERGYNVGKINEDENSTIGFVGDNIKDKFKNSLVFGHEKIGRGNIIYFTDNIMFRSFWENGKLFLVNSVFYVN